MTMTFASPKRLGAGFGLAFVLFISAVAAEAKLPVEAFGSREAISDVQLSPDGTHFAALQRIDGQVALAIFNPGGKNPYEVVSLDTDKEVEEKVENIFWMSNDRIGVVYLFEADRRGTPTLQSRLLSVDKSLNDVQIIPRVDRGTKWTPGWQSEILDMLWDDPDHILMVINRDEFEYEDGISTYKVNIKTGKSRLEWKGGRYARDYGMDQTGRIRLRRISERTRDTYLFLNLDTDKWDILTKKPHEEPFWDFVPMSFTADPNMLWVRTRNRSERDFFEIHEYNLKSGTFGRKIFSVPQHDVSGVREDPYTRGILGVSYTAHYSTVKYSDPEIAQVQATLDEALASTRNYITSYDQSRNKFIVFATSPRHPGTYYLYNKQAGSIQKLLETMPIQMPASELADMEPISYKARDGLEIPAYLTRPKGAGPYPLVVLPHGGPTARDYQRFDDWAQFLASRGYAVLQPQFRGSDGYGWDFRQAGKHEWGLLMQDDITDGAKEMIARGIADPGRMCIVGGSYGGYAALMGAVKTPDLFQCAVSFAGVSDIGALIRHDRKHYGWSDNPPNVGSLYKDGKQFRDTSPINSVDLIKVPILLVHGDKDIVVPPEQSTRFAKKLKKEGKPHKLVMLKGGSHWLLIERNRISFLKELEVFLGEHIGG